MKKLLLIAFVVMLAFVLVNRQRVFLRDPLARVYRTSGVKGADEVKQSGVQVYINYSNDVLLMKENPGGTTLLVQHWNLTPGTPVRLRCIHWMACMTDADQAPLLPATKYDAKVQMSNRTVSFIDPQGATTRVELR